MRVTFVSVGLVLLVALACFPAVRTSAEAPPSALVGAWTLNQDLSDRPRPPDGDGERVGRGGPAGGRGGAGRGGFGRGGMFGGGRGGGSGDREAMGRTRDAMRDILMPADHLTIVETDSTIIVTAQDGRTVRLAPGGDKIKDDNTGISRQTRWEGDTLVSEITGLVRGKITERYSVDREKHQLYLTLTMEGMQGREENVRRVYDDDRTSR